MGRLILKIKDEFAKFVLRAILDECRIRVEANKTNYLCAWCAFFCTFA